MSVNAAVAGVLLLAAGVGSDGTAILTGDSFWRVHVTARKPVVKGDGERLVSTDVTYRSYPGLNQLETLPPPAEWAAADFADVDWPRGRLRGHGSVQEVAFPPGAKYLTALLCLRGKFAVANPAAAGDLRLSLTYLGGVAVFLNGREVARQDLPPGPLTAETRATPYAGGSNPARRVLGPVVLPRDLLREGVNVLGLELHRCDYTPAALRGGDAPVPIGLVDVRLAASGTGVTPNVARPRGLQVWNQDVLDRVTVEDYGDPNEPVGPIRLIGARNGAFSGQVVIGSTAPIQGLAAAPGDLKALTGAASIPASCVQVRYGVLNGSAYQRPPWFDGLRDTQPPEVPVHGGAAVLPVYVTVTVPREAPPGEYRGALTLSTRGARPLDLAIHLSVADWALPDPRDFRTYVGIYQSPTTLSLQYNVPMWSEAHWALVERSFDLLARVGNKIVNIPLVDQTQFGNDEGFVYWVRRPDGSFDHDFTVFDRYIQMVKRRLGSPDFVALQVWHSGGWEMRQATQKNTVTVIDPATGTREHVQVPEFGTEESKRFWKPVLDAIRARLAREGMERAMCLGILSDGTAPPQVFRAFDELTPGGANWTRGCHSPCRERQPYNLLKGGGGRVVCHEFCYGMAMADPEKGLPEIWKQRPWPGVAYIRHSFDDTLSLLKYRNMAERALYCRTRGIGRICLDYWDVIGQDRRRSNVYNRWPHSSCAQRSPNLWRLAWPGPDGAAATARFEQVREGIQDAEAMIVVAEAEAEHAARLGPDLAARCRRVFVDRLNYCRLHAPEAYGTVYFRSNHYGWRDLTARLYATAAEVSKKVPGPLR